MDQSVLSRVAQHQQEWIEKDGVELAQSTQRVAANGALAAGHHNHPLSWRSSLPVSRQREALETMVKQVQGNTALNKHSHDKVSLEDHAARQ